MSAAIKRLAFFGAAVVVSSAFAAEEADRQALARRYVDSRPGIFKWEQTSRTQTSQEDRQRLVTMIVEHYLKSKSKGPKWNPDHPEWKRLAAIMEQDLQEVFKDVSADTRYAEVAKKVDDTFVGGIAAQLAAPELQELVQYYSVGTGERFAAVQQRLFVQLAKGMIGLQARRTAQTPAFDLAQFQQLLSLFDEFLRMQLGVLDPGPGKDRSGLQAIPIGLTAAVQVNFSELNAMWRELPEQDRAAILVWRASPLAKRERDAIYESAKGIRALFDPFAEIEKFGAGFAQYDAKWRALVRDARE